MGESVTGVSQSVTGMSQSVTGIGIIGCGVISGIYLQNLGKAPHLNVLAVADLDTNKAQEKAAAHHTQALSIEDLLAHPEIEAVLNLTVPKAHYSVSRAVLEAGKSVYGEKPLALNAAEGQALGELARAKGLWIGCAPDTFMGGGIQTCQAMLDAGLIGEPVGATAFMMSSGPESWHPSPVFFYEVGAGPLFDMGPYYLTALIALFGPIQQVTGSARISFAERLITSQPLKGKRIKVETPTHITALLDFASGPQATFVTTFDVQASQLPRIELYGSEATLLVPDPNTFGGPVYLRKKGEKEWQEVPLSRPYRVNSRGIGVADMARAMRAKTAYHRASGELSGHVLEAMEGILEAAQNHRWQALTSTCQRPQPLPENLKEEDWFVLA
jgi:predicted dehydrogenase